MHPFFVYLSYLFLNMLKKLYINKSFCSIFDIYIRRNARGLLVDEKSRLEWERLTKIDNKIISTIPSIDKPYKILGIVFLVLIVFK